MEELEKRIQINDNRILIYRVSTGSMIPIYTISEGFLENGEVIKTYKLSQWDDYGFNGWLDKDEGIKKLSFEFDINHPLYMPLFHLLNYDNELLIDDDDTREDNKKYMLIRREDNKIYIDFINELDNDINYNDTFNVFIKNIVFDGRSKIDQEQKDTKFRLAEFFNEVRNVFNNDFHQVSVEECLLSENADENCAQMKKTFKRFYSRRY